MEDRGLEPDSVTALQGNDLRQSADSFGTESGTVGGETGRVDPDLAVVVEAWPDLLDSVRADILAMVQAAGPATRPQ